MEWEQGRKLDKIGDLQIVEERWDVRLPDQLKDIIIKNNRARPSKEIFNTDQHHRVFGELLNFDLNSKNTVVDHYEWIKERLPNRVFPFGIDPAGNYLCLDYRTHDTNPEVLFWNHEGIFIDGKEIYQIEFVASNFQAFLNKLYANPSTDNLSTVKGFKRLD